MFDNQQENERYGNFPDPLASPEIKASKSYGLKYAKAIEGQWGSSDDEGSLYYRRKKEFETNRDYANGTQDTSRYKQILNSLDPNNGDGSLLNLDWSPVPIIPKFVKIVVNKILSADPYPNVEAVDPLSQSEKDKRKNKLKGQIMTRDFLMKAKELGIATDVDPESIPESLEEAEIFMDTNVKTEAEVAAQLATQMTLNWNNFHDTTYRRAVSDLVTNGMAVVKRNNDPNHGITEEYVDPSYFIHSYTEDHNFDDMVYAGHIKRITIQELKRLAGEQFDEETYEKIAKTVRNRFQNNPSRLTHSYYDKNLQRATYGYDEYFVEVLDFEFLSIDKMYFEEKETRHGHTGFYYKGHEYKAPTESVYERQPHCMTNTTLYGGSFIIGTKYVFNYGLQKNIPKNIHDITKTKLSYHVISTNLRRMMPKSLVSGIISFADQLQLSHLKLQQAIAKAKPDGLIIDIEGLENVQLGRSGSLEPLELQDIYEQTGVFYYRSKNPEGGFQNPPVRAIDNQIRNINELIGIYNHNLRMIRDATGINEVMDGTSPKGDQLVGVRQQQLAAGNNAIYDITHSAQVLYKRVAEDVIKCLQIIPEGSVLYRIYSNAIGETNMGILSSFKDLPMYNFGVRVVAAMDDMDRQYMEQNIQIALGQQEIDLEDAIAIRNLRDVDQAERLLILRRKKRIKQKQEAQMQNIQAQAQANAQTQQQSTQLELQKKQAEAQLEMQKIQMEAKIKAQMMQLQHQYDKEIQAMKSQIVLAQTQGGNSFRQNLEFMKEDRKDERIEKQAVEQSKLISQRQGKREELEDGDDLAQIFNNQ